jgi:hypothetical protein
VAVSKQISNIDTLISFIYKAKVIIAFIRNMI